jgi:predicted CXXCH cytochrome family protein
VIVLAVLVGTAASIGVFRVLPMAPKAMHDLAANGTYVGSHACDGCHRPEADAWRQSQHAAAMQVASAATVRGDFSDRTLSSGGVDTTFFMRDGKWLVSTAGPEGRVGEFEIRYTFGVEPLQQYLVAFPDGRLQALTLAWDTRAPAMGGGRWFDLYKDATIDHRDPLHWTGRAQNWNFMCAECHVTGFAKNYDARADRFDSRESEFGVGCEACHGPGSTHVAWALRRTSGERDALVDKGLVARLDERVGVRWNRAPGQAIASRSSPRSTHREIDVCAQCHARRAPIAAGYTAGKAFLDYYRPALLSPGLYNADGQQRAEVYDWGSFLQSRMYAAGVTCSDCHEPHAGKLRAAGNALCTRCHAPERYDATAHHHHRSGSDGAQCVNCHMPTTTYMGIDARHDHGLRPPRPDLSMTTNAPNACNACHTNRDSTWAAAQSKAWWTGPLDTHHRYARAFAAADANEAGASVALREVASAPDQPAIARASAIARLDANASVENIEAVATAARDADPLLRLGALEALAHASSDLQWRYGAPLLSDPFRALRIEAVGMLAASVDAERGRSEAFDAAAREYVDSQRYNADRPEARANLGTLYARLGNVDDGIRELRAALALDPRFARAYVDLADVYREAGQEPQAEATLRAGLQSVPRDATLHHALGLALVRMQRPDDALAHLAQAAALDSANARFAYVYAVAQHSLGQPRAALATLEAAHSAHPRDRDILEALANYHREAGHAADAERYRSRLSELSTR